MHICQKFSVVLLQHVSKKWGTYANDGHCCKTSAKCIRRKHFFEETHWGWPFESTSSTHEILQQEYNFLRMHSPNSSTLVLRVPLTHSGWELGGNCKSCVSNPQSGQNLSIPLPTPSGLLSVYPIGFHMVSLYLIHVDVSGLGKVLVNVVGHWVSKLHGSQMR